MTTEITRTMTTSKTALDQHDILKVTDIQQLVRAAAVIVTACAPLLEGGCLEKEKRLDFPQEKSLTPFQGTENLDNLTADITGMQRGNKSMPRQRVIIGYDEQGDPIRTNLSAATIDELNDKIVQTYIRSGQIAKFGIQIYQPVIEKKKKSTYSGNTLKSGLMKKRIDFRRTQ